MGDFKVFSMIWEIFVLLGKVQLRLSLAWHNTRKLKVGQGKNKMHEIQSCLKQRWKRDKNHIEDYWKSQYIILARRSEELVSNVN